MFLHSLLTSNPLCSPRLITLTRSHFPLFLFLYSLLCSTSLNSQSLLPSRCLSRSAYHLPPFNNSEINKIKDAPSSICSTCPSKFMNIFKSRIFPPDHLRASNFSVAFYILLQHHIPYYYHPSHIFTPNYAFFCSHIFSLYYFVFPKSGA